MAGDEKRLIRLDNGASRPAGARTETRSVGETWEAFRERLVEEARHEGFSWLILPLPNGGEERIDLRLH